MLNNLKIVQYKIMLSLPFFTQWIAFLHQEIVPFSLNHFPSLISCFQGHFCRIKKQNIFIGSRPISLETDRTFQTFKWV